MITLHFLEKLGQFLQSMSQNTNVIEAIQPIRSAYYAYVEDGLIILEFRILTEELNRPAPRESRWIDDARRVCAHAAGLTIEFIQGQVWIKKDALHQQSVILSSIP